MTKTIKAAFFAAGAIALSTAPAMARADEIYYLVGARHVYRVGYNPYANVGIRQSIEEDYANEVAAAQSSFNATVNNGGDPAQASAVLNQRLFDAASYRDYQLSQYYQPADYVLNSHPELAVAGDGPYQIVGVNVVHNYWSGFVVMAPWQGFYIGTSPYGWVYGHPYNPYAFHSVYWGWHQHWVSAGAPVFVGLYGSGGPVSVGFSVSINLGLRSHGFAPGPGFRPAGNWHGSFPHSAPAAFAHGRPSWAPAVARGNFSRPASGGSFARPGGNFSRPAVPAMRPSHPAGGFSRPAMGGSFRRPPGGAVPATRPRGSFSRPAVSTRPTGSFSRPAPAVRPSGGFGSRPSGGFSRPANTGSFSRPAPTSRPGGSFSRPSAPSRPSGGFGRPSSHSGGGNRRHGR